MTTRKRTAAKVPGAPAQAAEPIQAIDEAPAQAAEPIQAIDEAPAQAAEAAAVSDLPDVDSIDASTLKRPILTKQGWLTPATV